LAVIRLPQDTGKN